MNRSRIDAMIRSLEHMEALDRNHMNALQLQRLNELLKREKARGGFYKDLPAQLSALSELTALPFTTEEDLGREGHRMVLCSQQEIEKVITDQTSGSTGLPKRIFYTANDLENCIQLFMAGLGEFIYPGSVTMVCMPFSGPHGLGELIAEAISRLGAEPICCGPFCTYGEYSHILTEKQPDTFVGMPVQLLSILRLCGRGSLKRALISGDACPDSVVKSCEEILQTGLFPHYGSREMCLGGAITCKAHQGMHLRENHVIPEIIDEEGNVLPHGEWGELVITTIGMEAMPLIRYRTGDRTRILPGKCPCGSETLRLDGVSRISEHKTTVSLETLDDLIFRIDEVIDYQADKEKDGLSLQMLVKNTVPKAISDQLTAAVKALLPVEGVALQIRQCTKADKALYRAKRFLTL